MFARVEAFGVLVTDGIVSVVVTDVIVVVVSAASLILSLWSALSLVTASSALSISAYMRDCTMHTIVSCVSDHLLD